MSGNRILNTSPKPGFSDTGFFVGGAFRQWRYTGNRGVVFDRNPVTGLTPYTDRDFSDILLNFESHLIEQIKNTLKYFVQNLKPYHKAGSIENDILSIPFAILDFVVAPIPIFVAVLDVIATLIWRPFESSFNMMRFDGKNSPLKDLSDLTCWEIFFSAIRGAVFMPFFAIYAATIGTFEILYGILNTTLMLLKAAIEISLAVVTTALVVPIKGAVALKHHFFKPEQADDGQEHNSNQPGATADNLQEMG